MPYREKTAWLALIAMAVTFGPYFVVVSRQHIPAQPMPNLHGLELYAATALGQMVLLGLGHLILRVRAPQDARTRPDERDRAIMLNAIKSAYYVLVAGMILVGVVMPFNSSGWSIINAALFMIVGAEVVHYGVVAVSYRRQA